MNLSMDQIQYVEQVGRFWESVALGRTAGRILGWLMICEPDHQSASDLVETLGVSSGSVSTQTRVLESLGLVERVTFPGDRASYYRLPTRVWSQAMHRELDRITSMRKLADAGLDVLPVTRPERVTELGQVVDFVAAEWPLLMERLGLRLERQNRELDEERVS